MSMKKVLRPQDRVTSLFKGFSFIKDCPVGHTECAFLIAIVYEIKQLY